MEHVKRTTEKAVSAGAATSALLSRRSDSGCMAFAAFNGVAKELHQRPKARRFAGGRYVREAPYLPHGIDGAKKRGVVIAEQQDR
jgi:hypothetical protein